MNQPKCLLLAVLVMMNAATLASAGWRIQDQQDPPATLTEYSQRKGALVKQFNEQPDLSLEQKYALVQQILDLDAYTIAKLEAGDAAYLGETEQNAANLLAETRGGTIATAFFLANLLDEGGLFPESAKTLEYVVANSQQLYREDHWKTREYQLKLAQEQWLMSANEDQAAKFVAARQASAKGLAAFRANDASTARQLLAQAKATLEELGQQNTMAYGEAVANLAEAVAATDTFENTIAAFQEAITVNDQLFARKSPTNSSMRQSLAMYYSRSGKPELALAPLDEAADIYKMVYGEKSVPLANCLSLKGAQLQAMQKYQDGQDLHVEAYRMLNELGQAQSQAGLFVLDNMFNLYSSIRQYADAAEVARRAIPISEAVFADQPPQVVFWQLRCADSNQANAAYEQAIEYYSAAKALLQASNNTDRNRQYLDSLSGLAKTYYLMNKLDEAVALGAQAAELSKELAGEASTFHLIRAQNYALFLTQNKQYQEAEDVFARIQPLLKEALGEENIDYQKTVFDRATNLLRFEKADATIEQLQYLRGIQEPTIGRNHPDYEATLDSLAKAYDLKGAAGLAEKARQELAALKQAAADKSDQSGAQGGKNQSNGGGLLP